MQQAKSHLDVLKLMKASQLTQPELLAFPKLASFKLDGVRCTIRAGVVYSLSGKLIPNRHVQSLFGHSDLNGLDGELVVGPPFAVDAFRKTTSGVMSKEGAPDVIFYVFDVLADTEAKQLKLYGFADRLAYAAKRVKLTCRRAVRVVAHRPVARQEELDAFEASALELGYEGVMLRDPSGPYKHGRATEREGFLLKVKRFEDSEAEVLGVLELQVNLNERKADGKRTTHKAGKQPGSRLGALKVRDLKTSQVFEVGSGFDQTDRETYWAGRLELLGRIIKYKYFPSGSKNLPRFPVFLGFRNPLDM